MDDTKITVSKIDAAVRQLSTAIEIWFYDGDPVAIHTLAAAAYQITHDIKLRRGIDHDLLYDSRFIKEEYRGRWVTAMKKAQNFFKHADRDPDPDGTIDLAVAGNLVFLMVAAAGLQLLGVRGSHQIGVLLLWLTINEPALIRSEYLEKFSQGAQRVGVNDFEDIRSISKAEFFECCMRASFADEAASRR